MINTITRGAAVAAMLVAACGLVACDGGSSPAGDDAAGEINLMRTEIPGGIVAYVNGEPITFADVLREAQAELNQIEMERYRTVQSTIDRIMARRLVATAAAAQGTDPESWLRAAVDARVPEPPAAEVTAMVERYRNHPTMVNRTPGEMREIAIKEMTREQTRDAHIAIFEELRSNAEFESFLEPPRIAVDVPEGEPTWGPDDAPVTIVEFSDYQCEFCRTSHDAVQKVLAEYGDRVRFVYRDFAIAEHPRAVPAARAARCAGEQSRYWDYHDVLWSSGGKLTDADLQRHAQGLALDMNEFRACYESDRFTVEVARAFEDGLKLGVSGTPTFFVNGLVLSGSQTYETLKSVVDDELRKQAAGA